MSWGCFGAAWGCLKRVQICDQRGHLTRLDRACHGSCFWPPTSPTSPTYLTHLPGTLELFSHPPSSPLPCTDADKQPFDPRFFHPHQALRSSRPSDIYTTSQGLVGILPSLPSSLSTSTKLPSNRISNRTSNRTHTLLHAHPLLLR